MSRQNENEKNKKIDPVQIAIEQTDATLFEIASNLDQIEQDAQNTVTLSDEDKADVIKQVDDEHHNVFLAMNTIRGVDVDALCDEEGGEGDNQK
jgi:hypothetical protein